MLRYSFFIGIDISKKWIDVCLTIDGQVKAMPHSRFDNDAKGFVQMLGFIKSWIKAQKRKSADIQHSLFCMEHTGVYTFALCKFLQSKKLAFNLVNPLHLKHSLGLRRGKSDPADAADIARYAFLHAKELKPMLLPSDKLLIIKNLLSLRSRLVKSSVGLRNAAKELNEHAPSLSRQVIKYSETNVKQLQKTISNIEKQILELIQQDEQLNHLYQLLLSIKGVGLIIAAAMLVYTVAFTAFQNSRQFATYIGLAPFSQRSGSSVNVPAKVSHLAHKKIKGWISNGASCATNFDKELAAYYQRRIHQGKSKFAVQNAIRNKFVHRIFAVVKRGTPYVELAQFNN